VSALSHLTPGDWGLIVAMLAGWASREVLFLWKRQGSKRRRRR
jgi:hypothetical protein